MTLERLRIMKALRKLIMKCFHQEPDGKKKAPEWYAISDHDSGSPFAGVFFAMFSLR